MATGDDGGGLAMKRIKDYSDFLRSRHRGQSRCVAAQREKDPEEAPWCLVAGAIV